MNGFQKHTINRNKTIRDALLSLNKLSQSGQSVPLNLFVVDNEGVMLGSLTDGDIRRGLLSGKSLEDNLNK